MFSKPLFSPIYKEALDPFTLKHFGELIGTFL